MFIIYTFILTHFLPLQRAGRWCLKTSKHRMTPPLPPGGHIPETQGQDSIGLWFSEDTDIFAQ